MRQELDEQNERAKKAAMNIVSSQRAEFKEEEVKLRRKNQELSDQVGKLEKNTWRWTGSAEK